MELDTIRMRLNFWIDFRSFLYVSYVNANLIYLKLMNWNYGRERREYYENTEF